MRCEEVQELLSEYLEKLLDPGQSKFVDGHLASCPRCTSELAQLAECRRLVAGLAVVELPVGFTTRVMAHVRESAEKPSWWRRLFFSPPTRLPLSAAALLMISVMSVYLLQKEKPQDNLMPSLALQSETDAPKATDRAAQQFAPDNNTTLALRTHPSFEATALPVEPPQTKLQDKAKKEAIAPAKQSLNAQQAATGTQPHSQTRAEMPAPPPLVTEERSNRVASTIAEAELPPTPSRPIAGAIGVSQPAGGRAAPASPSMDAIIQERAIRAPLPERARSASPNPIQPPADIEIVIRRHPQPANEQRDNGDFLRKEVERKLETPNVSGLSTSRATPPQNDAIVRTIPTDQYEQFKKELAVQGTIISEIRSATRDIDGSSTAHQTLTIKVTVLPAETAR